MSILPLIQQLVIARMSEGPSAPRFSFAELGLDILAIILALTGLGFCLYGEYVWLLSVFTPAIAAFCVGGSAFTLALALTLVGDLISSGKSKRSSRTESAPSVDLPKLVSDTINSLSEELEEPIRDNPKTALMLASLAGFVAGERRH